MINQQFPFAFIDSKKKQNVDVDDRRKLRTNSFQWNLLRQRLCWTQ